MNERILSQISSLNNNIAKLTHHMVPPGLAFSNNLEDMQFLEQFPLSNWENLLICEEVLQRNNEVKEKFVC